MSTNHRFEDAQRAYDAASVHDDDTDPPAAPPVCDCCGVSGHSRDDCPPPCAACDGSGRCWVCSGVDGPKCVTCNGTAECGVCGGTGASVNAGGG